MTRAADRLIVCGADGVNRRPEGCWYNLVHDALEPLLVAEGEDEEKVLRYPHAARPRIGGSRSVARKRQRRRSPRTTAMASAAGASRSAAADS